MVNLNATEVFKSVYVACFSKSTNNLMTLSKMKLMTTIAIEADADITFMVPCSYKLFDSISCSCFLMNAFCSTLIA